jgi:hypothetical protein
MLWDQMSYYILGDVKEHKHSLIPKQETHPETKVLLIQVTQAPKSYVL